MKPDIMRLLTHLGQCVDGDIERTKERISLLSAGHIIERDGEIHRASERLLHLIEEKREIASLLYLVSSYGVQPPSVYFQRLDKVISSSIQRRSSNVRDELTTTHARTISLIRQEG